MESIVLIGGGGHACACVDVIEAQGLFQIAGFVDRPEQAEKNLLKYKCIGSDEQLPQLTREYRHFLITVGQIHSASIRMRLYHQLKELGAELPLVKSPESYISPYATVGAGTIVMHKAVVQPGARIGNNCIINTGAIIEHDAIIKDHCHISTGAVVNGGSRIGESSFIGSRAVIREGIEIGAHAMIGAGGRIMQSLPENVRERDVF